MAGLPFLKIFAILFKEVAKPLAARVKHFSQNHAEARRLAIVLGRWVGGGWERGRPAVRHRPRWGWWLRRWYEGSTQRLEAWVRGQRLKELKPVTDAHALTVRLVEQATEAHSAGVWRLDGCGRIVDRAVPHSHLQHLRASHAPPPPPPFHTPCRWERTWFRSRSCSAWPCR